MESYDGFAPYFDAWQQAFGGAYDALILGRVLGALRRHVPEARRVVDLGIGTGDLAIALTRAGYRVVGVDRSAAMLAVARRKAAAAGASPTLVQQDLRSLALAVPVDAAVCVYTVVNQLVGDDELLAAFRAVCAALVPGGVFVFEVNLPACYARHWTGTETVRAGDAFVTREHRAIAESPVVEAHVTIRDGSHVVHDRIAQRCRSRAEIAAALDASGFAPLACDAFDPFDAGPEPMKALWVARQRPRT